MITARTSLFSVGEQSFPMVVDYSEGLGEAYRDVVRHVTWTGDIELRENGFSKRALGKREFVGRYATLNRDNPLWNLEEVFAGEGLLPADTMQLFAFVRTYGRVEVTPQKPSPIVAASPCSTWFCSHDVLREMVGVSWSSFYHNPGIELSTISQCPGEGFSKDIRFLIVEE